VILALTFRTTLVIINIAAVAVIIGVIAYKVLSVRRTPTEKSPQNLTPFYDDTELEGNHLERVLRWALLFSTIVAVVLPLYWVLEPNRQTAEAEGFEERSIERGATLYANSEMPAYDGAKSLLCANCHGTDAGGGSALYTITPDAQGDANARPVQVQWRAPALNTVMYRFNECTDEDVAEQKPLCPRAEQQVSQIITYGRQGTPMPAWGIEGGGPKNDQAISDLVEYLKSIQLTPEKAKAQVQKQIAEMKDEAKSAVAKAQDTLAIVDEAIDEVTNLRGTLGAFQQNTLASTTANLQATLENTVNAESVIRDTDFAVEVAEFTKQQVLVQAGTSVLKNANQQPQLALSLLN